MTGRKCNFSITILEKYAGAALSKSTIWEEFSKENHHQRNKKAPDLITLILFWCK